MKKKTIFRTRENESVICKLCNKNFQHITNTHLWTQHQMTSEDYLNMFPGSRMMTAKLRKKRVDHLRGRTYSEIYGEEKGKELLELRKKDTSERWKEGYVKKEKKKNPIENFAQNISKATTKTGISKYRKLALDYYGLECSRCGKESDDPTDFSVHHKDGWNLPSELSDHSIENLMVLCKSCHSKLHLEWRRAQKGFVGIHRIEKGIHLILSGLSAEMGLDLKDPNFKDTPKRVARAYVEIFQGMQDTEKQIDDLFLTEFPAGGYDQMVISDGNKVYSMCPHHLLPVEYIVDVGYIPSETGFVLGVSKLSRLITILASRLVLQEKFTQDIGKYLEKIKPLGVSVTAKGNHFCMKMRGIKSPCTSIVTSYLSGVFKTDVSTRNEYLNLLNLSRSIDRR